MKYKSIFICLVIVVGFFFTASVVKAQGVAIVKNFDDPEIGYLESYLTSMGLSSTQINKDTLTFEMVANYDLLIWDDLSYQSGGLQDTTVNVFQKYYLSGKPIYFIGDDLAYSKINLSETWAAIWTDLIHLSGVDNFSSDYNVVINNTTHPVTNGPYGVVTNFDYSLDIDLAQRTHSDEVLLASTVDSDVLLAYDGPSARTVTQNCLLYQAGSQSSIAMREILFKNSVAWLIKNFVDVRNQNNSVPANFSLQQNYPNPFNPSTTISYSIAKPGNVKLTIYNSVGSRVAVIVDEYKPAGNYLVQLNSSNLASGIYLCRLESGNYSGVKKLILIK